jgi:hypothetical protein
MAGCGGDGGEATVEGSVLTWGLDPVPGATVDVFGTSLTATTDSSGEFTLQAVPTGDVFFVASASGSWGTIDPYVVPEETADGADLYVVPDEYMDSYAESLSRTISEMDSIVMISFYEGAQGGETATISADSDNPFTFGNDGLPVDQPQLIADDEGYGNLVFTGVDPAEGPITASVSGASGVTTCQVDASSGLTYPLLAKSITIVYAICEPAP